MSGGGSGALPPLVPPSVDPGPRTAIPEQQQGQGRPGLPLARVFDGVKPDGSPLISRPNLDPREIPALVAYLTRATVVLSAQGTTRDELVAGAPASVPRAFHTDGTWVWPAAVGYYLSCYRLPPQAELLAHIRARNYALGPVRPEVVQDAAAQVLAELKARPQQQQPQPQRPELPAPVVADLPAFSAAFNAAGSRHAAWVTEQLETFLAFLPLGDWSVDHTTRRYRQSGRDFAVDGLGTLSPAGVWTWAWADPATWGQNAALTEQSRRLLALGERDRITELVTPRFGLAGIEDAPESPQDAAEMIAWTAMGLLGARGYIGHSATEGGGGRIYYVVCDSIVPAATPRLDDLPRIVTEGAATFGEDAADCVLGYVEHHGWDWSRVPDGIAVAAEGIGSFTAELSADGELTRVSVRV